MPFDFAPTLTGPTLHLAPLAASDVPDLTRAAADPLIWALHPAKDRWKPEVFVDYASFLLESGGTLVIRDRETGRAVGCSRFYVPPEAPGDIAIGFTFLTRDRWGGASNREIKILMLGHAFADFETVWFHIDPQNLRSQAATAKLGATLIETVPLALGPQAVLWQRWALRKSDWHAGQNWGK